MDKFYFTFNFYVTFKFKIETMLLGYLMKHKLYWFIYTEVINNFNNILHFIDFV